MKKIISVLTFLFLLCVSIVFASCPDYYTYVLHALENSTAHYAVGSNNSESSATTYIFGQAAFYTTDTTPINNIQVKTYTVKGGNGGSYKFVIYQFDNNTATNNISRFVMDPIKNPPIATSNTVSTNTVDQVYTFTLSPAWTPIVGKFYSICLTSVSANNTNYIQFRAGNQSINGVAVYYSPLGYYQSTPNASYDIAMNLIHGTVAYSDSAGNLTNTDTEDACQYTRDMTTGVLSVYNCYFGSDSKVSHTFRDNVNDCALPVNTTFPLEITSDSSLKELRIPSKFTTTNLAIACSEGGEIPCGTNGVLPYVLKVHFLGNAPTITSGSLDKLNIPGFVIYYDSGKTGFGNTLTDGTTVFPTALWNNGSSGVTNIKANSFWNFRF